MNKLVLDYSKWRCGKNERNKVGEGNTLLLNNEGYMCCLGQFSLQLDNILKEEDILNASEPYDLNKIVPLLSSKDDDLDDDDLGYSNTGLATEAMGINDDPVIDTNMRIDKLKDLFKQYEYEIEVINYPKIETNENTKISS